MVGEADFLSKLDIQNSTVHNCF